MQHQVLIYGHDQILLRTRELILRGAGFDVCVTDAPDQARAILAIHPVDLLIFCHSVDDTERAKVLAIANASPKRPSTLLLSAGAAGSAYSENNAVFSTLDGPQSFLVTVCRLTHEPAPSSPVSQSPHTGRIPCPDLQAQ